MTTNITEIIMAELGDAVADSDLDKAIDALIPDDDEDELLEELVIEEPVTKKKRVKNYVNNADLLIEIGLSRQKGQMTDKLARMLIMLCDRYGTKPCFHGYSYLDDMKSFAMMALCRTWGMFDEKRFFNPFAYYTQCIKNSFRQYLKQETKHQRIRDELLIIEGYNPSMGFGDGDSGFGDSSDQ